MVLQPQQAQDQTQDYLVQLQLALNQWSLGGEWKILAEKAQLVRVRGKIIFRFHARDLHLVMGPGPDERPVHFTVLLDGARPGSNHGSDVDESGNGIVRDQRLYQLIRQNGDEDIKDRTFEIEFSDPNVEVYAFTFG